MKLFKRKKEQLEFINDHSGFTTSGFEHIDPDYDQFVANHEKKAQDLVDNIDFDWRNKAFFETITKTYCDSHINLAEKELEKHAFANQQIVNQLTTQINILQAQNEIIDFATHLFDTYYKTSLGGVNHG